MGILPYLVPSHHLKCQVVSARDPDGGFSRSTRPTGKPLSCIFASYSFPRSFTFSPPVSVKRRPAAMIPSRLCWFEPGVKGQTQKLNKRDKRTRTSFLQHVSTHFPLRRLRVYSSVKPGHRDVRAKVTPSINPGGETQLKGNLNDGVALHRGGDVLVFHGCVWGTVREREEQLPRTR